MKIEISTMGGVRRCKIRKTRGEMEDEWQKQS
jgi:hypothetical protein